MYNIPLHGNYILSSVIGSATVVSKERCGSTSAGDLARHILKLKKMFYLKEEMNFLCPESIERGQLFFSRFQSKINSPF